MWLGVYFILHQHNYMPPVIVDAETKAISAKCVPVSAKSPIMSAD